MKHIKNLWICLIVISININLQAQRLGYIKEGFDSSNFPNISFVYHSNNPNEIEKSSFGELKEMGIIRDFKVEKVDSHTNKLPLKTFILWEDMAHNGYAQFNFTQKVLSNFLNQIELPTSDKISLAAFNRRKNTPSTLINLTSDFTNDRTEILSAIKNYKRSTEHYNTFPNRSDLYGAIREAIELLAPHNGAKAIIVFTSGYSMNNSGSDSEAQVLLKAQQLHVPVYIFQYYYQSGIAPKSEGFANSTFGAFKPYKDVNTATSALLELYPTINKRYQGNDYKITFESDAQYGSQARMITLSINGTEIQEQFLPPSHTLTTWAKANPWWFLLLFFVMTSLIVGIILYIRRTQNKVDESRKEMEELEQRRILDKKSAEESHLNLINQFYNNAREKEKLAEKEKLHYLMTIKNLYPRIKYKVGTTSYTYEIRTPITLIGRENDNNLIITDQTISRHHAEIYFNGGSFEIRDRQSTNKVIVNGKIIEQCPLKNGDIIGLGEIVLSFYL